MKSVVRWSGIGVLALGVMLAPAAQAQQWSSTLSGATEPVPNASPATGFTLLTLTGNNLRVQVWFSGLTGASTVSHIHCCSATPGSGSAGVASPVPSYPGFPAGVTSGYYDQTFDLLLASSWNPAFISSSTGATPAAAMARLLAAFNTRTAYLNVHSSAFPGGEINGYLTMVPEPGTYALMATGLIGLGLLRRRQRRT